VHKRCTNGAQTVGPMTSFAGRDSQEQAAAPLVRSNERMPGAGQVYQPLSKKYTTFPYDPVCDAATQTKDGDTASNTSSASCPGKIIKQLMMLRPDKCVWDKHAPTCTKRDTRD
jgi:hypothetical protein